MISILFLILLNLSASAEGKKLTSDFCQSLVRGPSEKSEVQTAYRAAYLTEEEFRESCLEGLKCSWIFTKENPSASDFKDAWTNSSIEREVDKRYSWNEPGNEISMLVSFTKYPELAVTVAAQFYAGAPDSNKSVYVFEVELDRSTTIFPSQVNSDRLKELAQDGRSVALSYEGSKLILPIDDRMEHWVLGIADPKSIRRVFKFRLEDSPHFLAPEAAPPLLPKNSEEFLKKFATRIF